MNPLQVIRNEFFHKLGNDHIAVDQSGTPIARSTTRASVEQAAPNAAGYFSAADFPDLAAPKPPATPYPTYAPPGENTADRKAYEAKQLAAEPVKVAPSAGLVYTPKPVFEPVDKAGVDTHDLRGNGPHTDTPATFGQFSADPPVPANPAPVVPPLTLAGQSNPNVGVHTDTPKSDKLN